MDYTGDIRSEIADMTHVGTPNFLREREKGMSLRRWSRGKYMLDAHCRIVVEL